MGGSGDHGCGKSDLVQRLQKPGGGGGAGGRGGFRRKINGHAARVAKGGEGLDPTVVKAASLIKKPQTAAV